MKTIIRPCLLLVVACGLTSVTEAADSPTEVIHFDHAKVDEAFAKGQLLLTNDHYKVITGHRVEPGVVEVHEHDTDVIYVVEGSATFVTGGKAVDSKPEKPGELRGGKIVDGTTRHLTKGDVIVIPKGIPHWFTEVSGAFLYFVVKVTE